MNVCGSFLSNGRANQSVQWEDKTRTVSADRRVKAAQCYLLQDKVISGLLWKQGKEPRHRPGCQSSLLFLAPISHQKDAFVRKEKSGITLAPHSQQKHNLLHQSLPACSMSFHMTDFRCLIYKKSYGFPPRYWACSPTVTIVSLFFSGELYFLCILVFQLSRLQQAMFLHSFVAIVQSPYENKLILGWFSVWKIKNYSTDNTLLVFSSKSLSK